MLFAFIVSLYRWNLASGQRSFTGFHNYALAFTEGPFWNALWNSLRFTALSVPLGMAVALAIAVLVNQKLRGVTIFRTLYYIPAISSGVATAMLWLYVYLPENGLINSTLHLLGISNKTDFINNSSTAMLALVFMSIFTGLGPRMILYLAGLVNVSPVLYEAASLDGAGGWSCFRRITLPTLAPTTLFILVTSTISAMQLFTPIYMMTKGGPEDTTDVVGYHIYTEAWVNFNIGLASAKSFLVLVAVAVIAYAQFRLIQDRRAEGVA